MPLKIHPPRVGKTSNYSIRGTYLGVRVDQSAGTAERRVAERELKRIKREIEEGRFAPRGEKKFADLVSEYVTAGNDGRFLGPLLDVIGLEPISKIDAALVRKTAEKIYNGASPATWNRQVYTPISAVFRHSGLPIALQRPMGGMGKARNRWLRPEEANRLVSAAFDVDLELGIFILVLLYTGLRLTEALMIKRRDLLLQETLLLIDITKNGDPRGVHLPPILVDAFADLPKRKKLRLRRIRKETDEEWRQRCMEDQERLFSFHKNKFLYRQFERARLGAELRPDVTFHTLRHTYGTWMRLYGGLDARELVATGAWKSLTSAMIYDHVETTDAARKADLLPDFGRNWSRLERAGAAVEHTDEGERDEGRDSTPSGQGRVSRG